MLSQRSQTQKINLEGFLSYAEHIMYILHMYLCILLSRHMYMVYTERKKVSQRSEGETIINKGVRKANYCMFSL